MVDFNNNRNNANKNNSWIKDQQLYSDFGALTLGTLSSLFEYSLFFELVPLNDVDAGDDANKFAWKSGKMIVFKTIDFVDLYNAVMAGEGYTRSVGDDATFIFDRAEAQCEGDELEGKFIIGYSTSSGEEYVVLLDERQIQFFRWYLESYKNNLCRNPVIHKNNGGSGMAEKPKVRNNGLLKKLSSDDKFKKNKSLMANDTGGSTSDHPSPFTKEELNSVKSSGIKTPW